MSGLSRKLDEILQDHISAMSHSIQKIETGEDLLSVYIYDPSTLVQVAETAQEIFEQEPNLIEIKPPVVIVGDLHGHLLDLYRILTRFDLPPATKYLFLGDIVDRGPFSTETLTLVLVLKILYPQHVYIVRGNHEFKSISASGGFLEEVTSTYPKSQVFEAFSTCFSYMPLAAKINDDILCLHGGLSPDFASVDQVNQLVRPILEYDIPLLTGILWSDPSDECETFVRSRRGTGFYFGSEAFNSFMEANKLRYIIRGHQCVNGVSTSFDGTLITVFSASNYCGQTTNCAGVVAIREDGLIQNRILVPVKFIERSDAKGVNKRKQMALMLHKRAKTNSTITLGQAKMHSITGSISLFNMQTINDDDSISAARFELEDDSNTSRPEARRPYIMKPKILTSKPLIDLGKIRKVDSI